jgi:polysaccharide export outer membrane protein
MIKKQTYIFFLLILLSISHFMFGDEGEDYRLRLGDQMFVTLYGDNATRRLITVDPGGCTSYLLINNMRIKDLTIGEFRDEVTKKLATYYKNPTMIITPVNFASQYYTIIGQVRNPGKKPIIGRMTLLGALCEGQGFVTRNFRDETIDQVDLDKSFIARNGEMLPVDFRALIEGDLSQDVLIKPNDYIYLHLDSLNKVFVLGEVVTPSVVQFVYNLTLAGALAEAGSLTVRASSRIVVIRGSLTNPTRYLIDVNRILKGKAADFPLESGDIIYAPTMRFTTLKELAQLGVRSFVSTLFSIAGTSSYISIDPASAGFINSPVSTINVGGAAVAPVVIPPGI